MQKFGQISLEVSKSNNFDDLKKSSKDIIEKMREMFGEFFPRLNLHLKEQFAEVLKDEEVYYKLQRLLQSYGQISSRIQYLDSQMTSSLKQKGQSAQCMISTGKKITRAAMARRLEKNQQQIRKDQIFVRLTPKSQGCIQFMLSNRNFPRIQCKLSCNQHLEYLINYLTNKWIRGKVGFKILLYPDAGTFLKNCSPLQRQKALKQPLNNYFMFTDIMASCGIQQNGVLNLNYQIIEFKKNLGKSNGSLISCVQSPSIANSNFLNTETINNNKAKDLSQKFKNKQGQSGFGQKNIKQQIRNPSYSIKINTPQKILKEQNNYAKEMSLFNRNSNFFGNNDQSVFGSLGFNFGFGMNASKPNDHHLLSLNSINYLDIANQHETNERKQKIQNENNQKKLEIKPTITEKQKQGQVKIQLLQIKQVQELQANNSKLGSLLNIINQVQKEGEQICETYKSVNGLQDESQNNSNKVRDVKTVSIMKKKNIPN